MAWRSGRGGREGGREGEEEGGVALTGSGPSDQIRPDVASSCPGHGAHE